MPLCLRTAGLPYYDVCHVFTVTVSFWTAVCTLSIHVHVILFIWQLVPSTILSPYHLLQLRTSSYLSLAVVEAQ